MNGMNLWGARPFFPPGTPGLENPAHFPIPAHLNHVGMLALSSSTADRALSLTEKDSKDTSPPQPSASLPSGFPMFRPGDPIPAGLYSYQNIIKAQYELASQHAAYVARAAQAGEEGNVIHPASQLVLNSHPSAFVPAAKRPKLEEREEGEIERRGRGEEDRMSDRLSGSPTPASPSSRHTVTPDRSSGLDLTLDNRGSPACSNGQ